MRRPVAVGLTAVVVVAIAAAVFAYARSGTVRRVYVELPSAPGVREGSPVWYRGVDIGTVDSIGFTPERVRLRLAITRRGVPLRREDHSRLAPIGTAGEHAIDILPGPPTAPLLGARGVLAAAWPDTTRIATPEQTDSMIRDIISRSERAKDSAAHAGSGAAPRPRPR